MNNSFLRGLRDGLPICLGYIPVAFAFGIFAVSSGIPILETVLISMTNTTSAGQLAAVPIMAGGGGLVELAVSQLIINLRYSLMSVSLSQKFSPAVKFLDRLLIAFVNTDEVFAVASGQKEELGPRYFYGLILTPYLGWSLGTLVGAVAGDVLPAAAVSALGIAIYGMFLAIIIPAAKKSRPTALCMLVAVSIGIAFRFVPVLSSVSDGFVIIICAVTASALLAWLVPVETEEGGAANG